VAAACPLDVGDILAVVIITTNGLQGGVMYEVILKSSGGKQYPIAVLTRTGNNPGIPSIQSVSCQSSQGAGGSGGGAQ